jgi:hypothetical protein
VPPAPGALAGSANTISDGVGTLARAEVKRLEGIAQTISDGTAALSALYQLAGIASTISDGAAAIGSFKSLTALAGATSDGTGALTRAELKLLAANGVTVTDGTLTLLVAKDLLAQGNTVSDGTAQLDSSGGTAVNIDGIANTVSDGTSTLSVDKAIAANGSTTSDGTGAFGASQLPPSDSLMTLFWHSELGIGLTSGEVQTWTDQLQGLVVSAPGASQRPLYGADGANFNARDVVQCLAAGSHNVINSAVAAGILPTTGQRPYMVTVFRPAQAATTAHILAQCAVTPTGYSQQMRWVNGAAGIDSTIKSVISAGSLVTTQTPHIAETWADGSLLHCRVDGTDHTNTYTGSYTGDATIVTLGGNNGFTGFNANIAFFAVFSALPSSGYIASLRAWAAAYWGTPP